LLNSVNDVMLTDFEFAIHENFKTFESWDAGTMGFCPNPNSWNSPSISFTQKLVYRDIYALGNILLSCFNRAWYRKVVKEISSASTNWDIDQALSTLPENVQHICRKSNLILDERYESIRDFIQDVKRII
jgi:hypothetical protein